MTIAKMSGPCCIASGMVARPANLHLSGVVFPGRRRGSSPGRDRSRT